MQLEDYQCLKTYDVSPLTIQTILNYSACRGTLISCIYTNVSTSHTMVTTAMVVRLLRLQKKYYPQSFTFCFKNTLYSFVINAENKTLTICLAWRLWITFAIPLLDHYTTCSSLDSGSTFTLSLLLNYPFRFQSWINFNLFTLVF